MGDSDHKIIYARNRNDAVLDAWLEACLMFDSYEGMHGIRSIEEIMLVDGVCKSEAETMYEDERESYLEYDARIVSKGS